MLGCWAIRSLVVSGGGSACVEVPLPEGRLNEEHLENIQSGFEQVYRSLYGRNGPDVPLEVINWRVVASGPAPKTDFRFPRETNGRANALKGKRRAYFPEHDGYIETPVYDRYALAPGARVQAPAIVEERESTSVLPPGVTETVDEDANLIVEVAP